MPEVVAVPTRGMERWLTQRMSTTLGATRGRGDGVCANIDFPFPGTLVGVALASRDGDRARQRPVGAERLVWPLLQTVDESPARAVAERAGNPPRRQSPLRDRPPHRRALRPLRGPPSGDAPGLGARRRQRRRRAAAAAGRRSGRPSCGAGCASRSRFRARPSDLTEACARLRDGPDQSSSFHAASRCSASRGSRRATCKCSRPSPQAREVHVFVLHPSPALWDASARSRPPRASRRSDDDTATAPRNRLLASWGQDSRELQLVLEAQGEHEDHHHPISDTNDTLLARLQADIREDRSPPGPPLPGKPDARPLLRRTDRQPADPRMPRPRPAGRGASATRSCTCSSTTRRSSRAT